MRVIADHVMPVTPTTSYNVSLIVVFMFTRIKTNITTIETEQLNHIFKLQNLFFKDNIF